MLKRFQGPALREALPGQWLVAGNDALAADLARRVSLHEAPAGAELIRQGAADNGVYFILAGNFAIEINGRTVSQRGPNECVGEMAATMTALPRSATARAIGPGVIAKLGASDLAELGDKYPRVWREIPKSLADRLYQRNKLLREPRDRIGVFIVSSVEGLAVARAVEDNFEHDPFS